MYGGLGKGMYLVHVSRALGSLIPEIASMTEDFPTLWSPRTQIVGTSTSARTLGNNQGVSHTKPSTTPHPVECT